MLQMNYFAQIGGLLFIGGSMTQKAKKISKLLFTYLRCSRSLKTFSHDLIKFCQTSLPLSAIPLDNGGVIYFCRGSVNWL